MICKQVLALFLWCHCYQIVLNPLLQLLAIGSRAESTAILLGLNYQNNLLIYAHSQGPYVVGSPITVEANQVALTPGQEIVLRCNIAEYPNEQFSWYRVKHYSNKDINNQPPERNKEELKQIDDKYIINNNVIILKSPTFSDQGEYYCRIKNPRDDMEAEKMITVRARPFILDFDIESSTYRSVAVEEGKSLKIPCNIIDDFAEASSLRVNWQMSKFEENDMNDVISGEDGITTTSYNETSHALIIDKVTKDHRRFYKCHVTNGVTDNSKVILLRVKDKFTVWWPTIGIIIELVILIGVIIVVENRKVEPDKDTYDRKAIQM